MRRGSLLQLGALAIAVAPFTMWGALIGGTTAGKTVVGGGPDDVPYDCENGQAGVSNADCTGGVDDSLTSQTLFFQSFIEQDKVISGTNYQVLYGGVQWGYSLTMVEAPEPSSMLLAGLGLLAAGLCRRRVRRFSA
jgi:PEP-CTERM motif